MKLTCVTAVFNAIKAGNRERLIRCVESIAKLKTEHEHLIYDGASTDGTVELLRELEAKTPGLKVVSEPDTGIYNALNKGVRDAKGEWFYVLGADDYICHPKVMDSLLFAEKQEIEIIAATVERDHQGFPFFKSYDDLAVIFENTPCCHQGEIVRTELMRRMGGFDERFAIAADADFFFRAHLANINFHYVFTPFANYAYGGLSESCTTKAVDEFFKCVGINLGLNTTQKEKLQHDKLLPIGVALPLIFHSDIALRLGARKMVRRYLSRTVVWRCISRIRKFLFMKG